MLRIGELAALAGVSTKTIRHYHRIGLLPSAGRDSSNYRRYDLDDVVLLQRIRLLATGGLPLARIRTLLHEPTRLDDDLDELDAALQRRIAELSDVRRRLDSLRTSRPLDDDPLLADLLTALRATGVDEQTVTEEQRLWSALRVLYPAETAALITDKRRALDDPEVGELYREYARLAGRPNADPEVRALKARAAGYVARRRDVTSDVAETDDAAADQPRSAIPRETLALLLRAAQP